MKKVKVHKNSRVLSRDTRAETAANIARAVGGRGTGPIVEIPEGITMQDLREAARELGYTYQGTLTVSFDPM